MPFRDDFRSRANREPTLRAIVDTLLAVMLRSEVTGSDVVRCAVLACQEYAEKYHTPMIVRLEQPSKNLGEPFRPFLVGDDD